MSSYWKAPSVTHCRHCGRHRDQCQSYGCRGLCGRCYYRLNRDGLLDRYPVLRAIDPKGFLAAVEQATMVLPPEKWAADLGMADTALARRLYRYGRPDLARKVQRLIKREDKRPSAKYRKKIAT